MPIIKLNKSDKPEKIKFYIEAKLLAEINEYCSWIKLEDKGIFFTQAAEFLLKKDKDWKLHQKKKN